MGFVCVGFAARKKINGCCMLHRANVIHESRSYLVIAVLCELNGDFTGTKQWQRTAIKRMHANIIRKLSCSLCLYLCFNIYKMCVCACVRVLPLLLCLLLLGCTIYTMKSIDCRNISRFCVLLLCVYTSLLRRVIY